jgi:serine protease SohB
VHFELFTAGKMKRTVVPFKTPTDEDKDAVNDKLQGLHTAFKQHVQGFRPQVTEATMDGDYFMAKDHVGTLVDELGDSNSAILHAFASNIPLFRVTTEVKRGFSLKRLFGADSMMDDFVESLTDRVMAKVFDGGYTGIR